MADIQTSRYFADVKTSSSLAQVINDIYAGMRSNKIPDINNIAMITSSGITIKEGISSDYFVGKTISLQDIKEIYEYFSTVLKGTYTIRPGDFLSAFTTLSTSAQIAVSPEDSKIYLVGNTVVKNNMQVFSQMATDIQRLRPNCKDCTTLCSSCSGGCGDKCAGSCGTGCTASCTGTCSGCNGCSNKCSSCTGGCGGGCSGCVGSCNGCYGTCGGNCGADCGSYGGCTGTSHT